MKKMMLAIATLSLLVFSLTGCVPIATTNTSVGNGGTSTSTKYFPVARKDRP